MIEDEFSGELVESAPQVVNDVSQQQSDAKPPLSRNLRPEICDNPNPGHTWLSAEERGVCRRGLD